jgi:hypothetical protein
MLSAVQIHNNPQVDFKAELFIVTSVIAWTYLLHAYYRKAGVEYRQVDPTARENAVASSELDMVPPGTGAWNSAWRAKIALSVRQ